MPVVLANPKNANEISFEQRARDLKDQEQKEQEERTKIYDKRVTTVQAQKE